MEKVEVGVGEIKLKLEPAMVNVSEVRVVYAARDAEGDEVSKYQVVWCHFWQMEGEAACFYRVMGERLQKFMVIPLPVHVMEVE